MAGEISAVVQITAASWKVVDRTILFIREMRVIDKSVERLVQTLHRLRGAIALVAKTCDRAGGEASNDALVFIRATLATCEGPLDGASNLVQKLAAQDSNHAWGKFKLKVRSDWWKPDIDAYVKEIELLVGNLNTGIHCWTLDIAQAKNWIADDVYKRSPSRLWYELQRILREDHTDSALDPIISNASTLRDSDAPVRLDNAVSAPTRITEPPSDNGGNTSPLPQKDEEEDEQGRFHFQVAKCMGDPNKVTKVWATLNRHQDGSALARSADKDGRTPLHLAAENDDVELGRVLVCFDADVNAEDREPASILDFAVANNHDKFVEFLLEEGVDESKIAAKNQTRLKELQQVIDVRKAHRMKGIRTPKRTQSLTNTRRVSITARVRAGSIDQ